MITWIRPCKTWIFKYFMPIKKPSVSSYPVKNGDLGLFTVVGDEPIDSPLVGVRLPMSLYNRLQAAVGKSKSEWLREAIAEKLQRENS
jgi:hypothetical protein